MGTLGWIFLISLSSWLEPYLPWAGLAVQASEDAEWVDVELFLSVFLSLSPPLPLSLSLSLSLTHTHTHTHTHRVSSLRPDPSDLSPGPCPQIGRPLPPQPAITLQSFASWAPAFRWKIIQSDPRSSHSRNFTFRNRLGKSTHRAAAGS